MDYCPGCGSKIEDKGSDFCKMCGYDRRNFNTTSASNAENEKKIRDLELKLKALEKERKPRKFRFSFNDDSSMNNLIFGIIFVVMVIIMFVVAPLIFFNS